PRRWRAGRPDGRLGPQTRDGLARVDRARSVTRVVWAGQVRPGEVRTATRRVPRPDARPEPGRRLHRRRRGGKGEGGGGPAGEGAEVGVEPEVPGPVAQPAWKGLLMPLYEPGNRTTEAPLLGTGAVDPAWLAWKHGAVLGLARDIARRKAFDLLPILGDALEGSRCNEPHT